MTDLDPSAFPYVIECKDCPHDTVAEITHDEATEAIPPGVEATVRQAVDRALSLRGWADSSFGGVPGAICPKCMEDLD